MSSISFDSCRYTVGKSDDEKSFIMDVSVEVCIDGSCVEIPVVSQVVIPIPICNPDATLPGDGTLNGVLDAFESEASENAIELALKYLGISVGVFLF